MVGVSWESIPFWCEFHTFVLTVLCIERQNTFCVNLVFSKMQLVSKGTSKKRLKKDITLPRLELLAVTTGVRAANFVAYELKITPLK